MVPDTDTIVDPWAVMVKALNTMPTDTAVSTATCANRIAVRAELCAFYLLKHVHKVDFVILEVSRFGAGGASEE